MPNKLFSKDELKDYRTFLLVIRKKLAGDVTHLEDEALKKNRQDASGDLSNMPMHLADLGTDNFEQDVTLGLAQNESIELQEIDDALDRIKDGSFGICENCKKPIPRTRLKAIPYALLCAACKMKEEQS